MATIPQGIICIWLDTEASIPAGWSRVADMDSRFPKGAAAATNPGVTGGAATHTHVDPGHSHTSAAHTHAGNSIGAQTATSAQGGGGSVDSGHLHTGGTSGAMSATGFSSAISAWDAISNLPAYYNTIYIESDGTPTGIPDDAAVWWNSATGAAGWTQHVASKLKYNRGAPTAIDSGGTGGANTHVHNDGGHNHTMAHGHGAATSGAFASNGSSGSMTGGGPAQYGTNDGHTHSLTIGSSTPSTSSNSNPASDSENGEPAYYVLPLMQNTSGVPKHGELDLYIVGWLGLLASVPAGWLVCDGSGGTPDLRGKFIRNANAMADFGTTGGAAGHSHAVSSGHTHTLASHSHTQSVGAGGAGSGTAGSGTPTAASPPGSHSGHSGGSNQAATAGASSSFSSTAPTTADTQPPFRTMTYLMLSDFLEVTIDDPTDAEVVSLPSFLVDWSFTGGSGVQATYQLEVYENDGMDGLGALIYDSGVQSSATESATIPLGYLVNATDYIIQVTIADDGTPSLGGQARTRFTTDWSDLEVISGLTLTPVGGV